MSGGGLPPPVLSLYPRHSCAESASPSLSLLPPAPYTPESTHIVLLVILGDFLFLYNTASNTMHDLPCDTKTIHLVLDYIVILSEFGRVLEVVKSKIVIWILQLIKIKKYM